MFKLPGSIKNAIDNYSRSVNDFIQGRISWARFVGIRVPWGNYSHRGGKVFMARVRIAAGTLTPEQLKALAFCAKEYGNGILHITTRQDVQIHDVNIENIVALHYYLMDYELSSRGGGGNTIRNIITPALAGICQKEVFDIRPDAIGLTEHLLALDDSYNMPRKCKIAFACCDSDCVGARLNDIGLFAAKNNGVIGYKVYAAGGMGAGSAIGNLLEEFIPREDLVYVVSAIKRVFYKHGDRKDKYHNRMRFLVQDIGFTRFKEYYKEELKDMKENEYISLRTCEFTYPAAEEPGIVSGGDKGFDEFLRYSTVKQKQQGLYLVRLRIPLGDINYQDALALANLGDEFKGIEFRTSCRQNIYAANVHEKDLRGFYEKLKAMLSDFLYPSTLLDIVSCKGSVTCNLGLCNSPALTAEIERVLKESFLGRNVFNKARININGCPNACGQHPAGMIALHGVARKVNGRLAPFYKLFLGGRRGLDTTRLSKDTKILISAKNVPAFLKNFLESIDSSIDKKTDIHKFIAEHAEELAQEAFRKYSYVPDYEQDKSFYFDWGKSEVFSLENLGPGECSAGILDIINADLSQAGIVLKEAEKKEYDKALLKEALHVSARALLVTKGKDPSSQQEAITLFKKEFVDTRIASSDYENIEDSFKKLGDVLSANELKDIAGYIRRFLEHVNYLYKSMDSSLNFPKQETMPPGSIKQVEKVLDLKGTPCPINYVKAKLYMENMDDGDVVDIWLDEGEPMDNVPKSLKADGHEILNIEKHDTKYKLTVKKHQEIR